jgi:hypothetical protein
LGLADAKGAAAPFFHPFEASQAILPAAAYGSPIGYATSGLHWQLPIFLLGCHEGVMMHMPIQFDTLDYAKRLASSGVPAVQAEAHAAALGDVLGSAVVVHGELAAVERNVLGEIKLVRQEMKQLEQKIESRFDAWEQKTDHRIEASEQKTSHQLITWEQRSDARASLLQQSLDARLERMDLRHGADMKHLYWMMGTLVLLSVGILSRLVLQ